MIVFPVLLLLLRREKSAGSQPMFQTATLEFSSSKWRTLKVYQCNICQIRFSFVIEMRCEMRRIWDSSLRIHHPFVFMKSNFHIAFLYVQSLWAQTGSDVDALGRGSLVGTFFFEKIGTFLHGKWPFSAEIDFSSKLNEFHVRDNSNQVWLAALDSHFQSQLLDWHHPLHENYVSRTSLKLFPWEDTLSKVPWGYQRCCTLYLAVSPGVDRVFLVSWQLSSSWWFQPTWKKLVKLDHFPR